MRHDLKKIAVSGVAFFLVGAGYCGYVLLFGAGRAVHHHTTLSEIGEIFGKLNLLLFGLIYGRTALRIILQNFNGDSIADSDGIGFRRLLEQLYGLLDRYHVQIGLAAVISIFTHAWMMTGYQTNLLLYGVLALVSWQGVFGAFLKLRYTPATLKKHVYLAHAQLYTGVAILNFAFFGHLLYGHD